MDIPPPPPPPLRPNEPGVPVWFREPTLGQRFAGAVLDWVVLLPVLLVELVIGWGSVAGLTLVLLVRGAYEILFTARDGQTIGKRVLGTRAVDLETGSTPTLDRCAVRWLVLSGIASLGAYDLPFATAFLLFSIAVQVPILQRPLHRGLHDRAAGTVVTSVRP